jgi:hypothetical protein
MLLSAVSVLVIALQSPQIPEGLMNNPVYQFHLAPTTDRMCSFYLKNLHVKAKTAACVTIRMAADEIRITIFFSKSIGVKKLTYSN